MLEKSSLVDPQEDERLNHRLVGGSPDYQKEREAFIFLASSSIHREYRHQQGDKQLNTCSNPVQIHRGERPQSESSRCSSARLG